MAMNLSGKLPEDRNGLPSIETQLVDDPRAARLAVIEYDVIKIATDVATGSRTPTLRILAVEPIVDSDERLRLLAMIRREATRRTIRGPLPGQLDLFTESETGTDESGAPV